MSRILIAGMGNILRLDDGFGVVVANRLQAQNNFPDNVKIIEVGIGGIHLVQELMAGFDALIIIDALERGSAPGTIHVLEATVPSLAEWNEGQRADFLADMHYATPNKAMILSKALHVLPPRVFIVGCQALEANELGIGLSAPVERATTETIRHIENIVARLNEKFQEQEREQL